MPIVFVHGVNNRKDDEYRDNEIARDAFLRKIVAPALGLPEGSAELKVVSPYWGGDGAKFAWNMAVLPTSDASYEAFGSQHDAEAFGRTLELVATAPPMEGGVVERAKQDFAGTVDLLYGAAIAGVQDEGDAQALAEAYLQAAEYARKHPKPDWLDKATDDNFADYLNSYVSEEPGTESMGIMGNVLDRLKEGLGRMKDAIPDVASQALVNSSRKKLNATVSRFTGDAFVYLATRNKLGAEAPIVKVVMAGLKEAQAARTGKDDKLVVIAHSFGGEIVYDVLTRFWPDLEVDCLVTVGSQVGLFEEMKLYDASDPKLPSGSKVAKPPKVKRWLNVFDPNDILSYLVEPVFHDAQDFKYDTGYSTLQAHGGYFLRPSFYKRLAERLKQP